MLCFESHLWVAFLIIEVSALSLIESGQQSTIRLLKSHRCDIVASPFFDSASPLAKPIIPLMHFTQGRLRTLHKQGPGLSVTALADALKFGLPACAVLPRQKA